ncbi:MAG: hypothetical protein JKY95_06200 [Planctomycetaceae bacterium]|nr:hypothetical protein [Planctomycetaceae bacterium]
MRHQRIIVQTFFNENPATEGNVIVHHAVKQQVLKRYPKAFKDVEINSLENLRGIPKKINNDMHLSKIRKAWNNFYRTHSNPTRQQILDKATEIDDLFGHLFNPPIR